MAVGRRPKRRNPEAERLTFVCELECCPACGERLSSQGTSAHSRKTVQTLEGEFYVVAYSRVCQNPECSQCGTHYHAAEHLKVSPPSTTYGMDVIALVGIQRDREHKQFGEIERQLNARGVAINDWSVGQLYRRFQALVEGAWPHRRERIEAAATRHGGLILMADGLAPEDAGPQLYVLWEVFSGTPVSGMLIDRADTPHLRKWLSECRALLDGLPVLALLSDQEKALGTALRTVWKDTPHQLCQMHLMQNLSEPVQREDQKMRQTLRDQLSGLPSIPDLEPEEAEARMEHLVSPSDALEGKKAP